MPLYEKYKPLRNRCRDLELEDALYVIWAYSQFLQIKGFEFPPDIDVAPEFLREKVPQRYISEWELESLAREVVLHSGLVRSGNKTLKKPTDIANVVNSLKALEEEVSKDFINQDNILIELNRIANRQFVWQRNPPNAETLSRYYKIFSHPEIERIIERKTGLSVKDILYVGMALVGVFMKSPAIKIPIRVKFAGITPEKMEAFSAFTSAPLQDLRKKIADAHVVDENIAYAYNDLRERPMIGMRYRGDQVYFCPLPTLLFWRMTGGLYYEVCREHDFSGPFGDAFEAYVGDVLRAATDADRFSTLPEEQYGNKKNRKHTVDWILVEAGKAALFIECKTKRLSWKSKIALTDMGAVEQDLDYVASAVVQLYKTIEDYKKDLYTSIQYDPDLKIYPLVTTLESWNLFGPESNMLLENLVLAKLEEAGLNAELISDAPFGLCSVDELERMAQLIQQTDIHTFMDPKVADPEKQQWMFDAYIQHYNREYGLTSSTLFQDVYDQIFEEVKLIARK